MTTEALAVRERDITDLTPRLVVSLDVLKEQLQELERFKREIMVPDVDYGVIPGTPKPTLLKPGAEKLSVAFGLAPVFEVTGRIEDWDRGFFHYEVRCDLISKRTGSVVASAHGSANSKEPRYRWRDAKPVCPDCGFELRRSKRREGDQGDPGWYCWTRFGGCGATFPSHAVKVEGRIENPEPYELVNTILKMSEKRALVAAALIATGGSGHFTQDVEDMPSVAGEGRVIDVTPPNGNDHPQRSAAATSSQHGASQRATSPRQAQAAAAVKTTDTRCSVCDRMVENAAVLKSAVERFTVPYCIAHFNEAMDQATDDAEKDRPL